MSLREILLLNGGIATGFALYKYYQYKCAMKEVDDLISKRKFSTNTALFFCASGLGDCEKHIYKKRMCEKPECPYRKLKESLDFLLHSWQLTFTGKLYCSKIFYQIDSILYKKRRREKPEWTNRKLKYIFKFILGRGFSGCCILLLYVEGAD